VTKMKVSFAKETLDRCKVKRECGKFPWRDYHSLLSTTRKVLLINLSAAKLQIVQVFNFHTNFTVWQVNTIIHDTTEKKHICRRCLQSELESTILIVLDHRNPYGYISWHNHVSNISLRTVMFWAKYWRSM
jgi:ribosomal protein L23